MFVPIRTTLPSRMVVISLSLLTDSKWSQVISVGETAVCVSSAFRVAEASAMAMARMGKRRII
jgi:hypothetical protein